MEIMQEMAKVVDKQNSGDKRYINMSRVCDVTGRKPMFGNNVSHAHNKTRRRFNLNLQKKRFWVADENRWITLTVSTQGLRLIDKVGIRKVLNKMKAEGKKV